MRALDNLTLRLGLILLAGMAAVQAAIVVVVFWPGEPGPAFRLPPPRTVAAMAEALEAADPVLRPTVLKALNSDPLAVELLADFPDETTASRSRRVERLERLFARYADGLGGRVFEVQSQQGAILRPASDGAVAARAPVRVLVRLNTGEVLVVERRTAPLVQRVRTRALILAAAVAVILGLVLIACVRQTARPVNRLARASRRFARSLSTDDLPLDGAKELRDLSAAFNEMKRTIRGLVDERTRILAAMAHDFRTYLTRLRLRTEFIEDIEHRAKAEADLDEMAQLIDDTLLFAYEATKPDNGGACDAVAEALRVAAFRVELGEAVTCEAAGTAWVACSPASLRRMLGNLLDNAARYAGSAHLRVWRDGAMIHVAVEDRGPGAPADRLAMLTEPFERLEASRGRDTGGAGLGLSIVKALAESRGGGLSLENRPEGGLRAVVALPGLLA